MIISNLIQKYIKQKINPRECPLLFPGNETFTPHAEIFHGGAEILEFMGSIKHITFHSLPPKLIISGINTTNKIIYVANGEVTLNLNNHHLSISKGKKFNLPKAGFPTKLAVGDEETILLEFSDRENNDFSSMANLEFVKSSKGHMFNSLKFTQDWPSPIEQAIFAEYAQGNYSTSPNIRGRETLTWVMEGSVKSYWEEKGDPIAIWPHPKEDIFFTDDMSKSRLYGVRNAYVSQVGRHYKYYSRTLTLADKVAEINPDVSPGLRKVLERTSAQ
ncbi:MAG: hypothetical protein Q8L29_04035 [archaeon]|nr:hypothetical protein [archaeon]